METRFKLPTKILSSFLAVLMAVSCFGIALPNLVPSAGAAATTQDYKSLVNAFESVTEDDGTIGSSKYTVTRGADGETLITDNTDNGSVYKLAEALFDVASAENGSFAHNTLIRERIKKVFNKNGDLYTSSMEEFVALLLPVDGDYAHDSSSPVAGAPKLTSAGEPEAALTATLKNVVKVTRSEKSVVLTYDDVNDVPEKLDLTVVLTTEAAPKSEKSTFTDAAGLEYSRLSTWYENTSCTVSHEQSDAPDFSALKKFMSYIKSASFAPYYEAYTNDNNSIYTLDASVVAALSNYEKDYYTTKVSGLDNDYLDKYLATGEGETFKSGLANASAYNSFIAKVKAVADPIGNRKFVDWVMKGTSVENYHDRDSYLPHEDGSGEIVEPDEKTVKELLESAKQIKDILNDSTYNNIYVNQFGYVNGTVESLISKIEIALQRLSLDKVFENIVFRMENNSDKYFDDDMAYFGLADYDSSKYATGEMPITDEMLDAAINWFDAQFAEVEKAEFDDAGRDAAVAAAGSSTITTYQQVKDFYNKLVAERQSANRKQDTEYIETYYNYFNKFIMHAASLDTAYMAKAFQTEIDAKVAECRTAYNAAVTKLGKAAADKIFGDYSDRADLAKAAIKSAMNARLLAQCKLMDSYASGGITVANFSLVKAQYGNINNKIITVTVNGEEQEISLYQWCKNNGYNGADYIYNKYENTYKAQIDKIIADKWNNFTTISLSNNGVYTVRHALSHDMARYLKGDGADIERYPYTVTTNKVDAVITKLDTFLTSKSFTQLLGVDGKSEYSDTNIETLSDYIEDILIANVFSDKMVNTIVSALFPMLTDLLTNTLTKDLGNLLGDLGATPSDSNADAAINLSNLGDLGGVKFSGILNVYLNGKEGTNSFVTVFKDIGLWIHPVNLAAKLEATGNAQYKTIIADLKKANADWLWFDKIANGGNGDGKVSAEDFVINSNGKPVLDSKGREQPKYTWGVKDYSTFTSVMGDVFSAAMEILKAVFTEYTFKTPNMTNLLRAKGSPGVNYKIFSDSSVPVSAINSNTYLTISGMKGYSDVWAPIFEALGINSSTSGYSTAELSVEKGYALSRTFGSSANKATNAEFVNALFNPLMILIDKLANAPLATLTGLLPNVANAVAYNMITPLVNSLSTTLNLSTGLHMDKLELWGIGIAGITNRFVDKEGLVNQNIDLKLGAMLDLNSMLAKEDIDITDLNSIANKVVNGLGDEDNTEKKVDLPAINAGKLGHLGTKTPLKSVRTQNQNSTLGGGNYYYVVANRADVLYDLLSWVLKFISGDGNLSGLMAAVGSKGLGTEIDSILKEINADGALAALVELFLPLGTAGSGSSTGYDFASFDWYKLEDDTSFSYSTFVYTKYGNFWTKDKAKAVYNNIEEVANDLIKKYAPKLFLKEGGKESFNGIGEWLSFVINDMFDNEGIHNVTKLFSSIGAALADQQTIVELLKEQINGGDGVDLACWYNTFGYLDYDYTALDEAAATLMSSAATDEEKAAAEAVMETAPLRPEEVRSYTGADGTVKTLTYKSEFPNLTVEVINKSTKEVLNPLTDNIGALGETNVDYKWTFTNSKGEKKTLVDDGSEESRRLFTDMFVYLFTPTLPLVNIILTGKDLSFFNNALVIKGYDCYSNGLVPILEMLGVTDLPTTAQFMKMDAMKGLNKLVDILFNYVTYLLTPDEDGTTVQKVINLFPRLFYFLQSDGLTTILKNLLQPFWVLIDTLRPIADVDLDGFLHQFLCDYLGLAYDKTAPEYKVGAVVELVMGLISGDKLEKTYTPAQIKADKESVDAIYSLSIEDLSLEQIYKVVELMFEVDLSPLTYAFKSMCRTVTDETDGKTYGVVELESKRGVTDYTLNYSGADTITVTLSVLLDLLRYKDNAKGFDKLFGFVKEKTDRDSNITAAGLLEALEAVFLGEEFDLGKQPNWDYIFEGKKFSDADGNLVTWVDIDNNNPTEEKNAPFTAYAGKDISAYHSIYNLQYVTDWTEDTAKKTVNMLSDVLNFVATYLKKTDGTAPENFKDFITDLLDHYAFNGNILYSLAELMCKMYDFIPDSACKLLGELLSMGDEAEKEVDFFAWKNEYLEVGDDGSYKVKDEIAGLWKATTTVEEAKNDDGTTKKDDKGNPVMETKTEVESLLKGEEAFFDALTEILTPAAPIFAWLFLNEDISLFYTVGDMNKDDMKPYGNDAITLDGVGIYAKAIIPLLEALGYDLKNFEFVPDATATPGTEAGEAAASEKHDLSSASYFDTDKNVYLSKQFTLDFVQILRKVVYDLTSDPINWILDRLPGIVYFINAKGLTTIVENVFDSVKTALDAVNTQLDEGSKINLAALAKLINEAVGTPTTDITGELGDKLVLDFDTIVALLEKFTGIHIDSFLQKYMKGLYVGRIKEFTSANGRQSFTMVYSSEEDKHDMVTILFALLLEVVEDKGNDSETGVAFDNPAAIDKLITKSDEENKGLVSAIVNALRNPADIVENDINWKYFEKEVGVVDDPANPGEKVQMPAYKYLYLNYTTDWTADTAKSVQNNINDLVLGILKMAFADEFKTGGKYEKYNDEKYKNDANTVVKEIVNDLVKLDTIYTADTLNSLQNLLSGLLYGADAKIPAALTEFAGALLGADLTSWNYTYSFEAAKVDGETYLTDTENGLEYRNGEFNVGDAKYTGKIYVVNDRATFISGATLILKPAYRLLDWLLLGRDYTFFNAEKVTGKDSLGYDVHPTLITLQGANGYGSALAYILEALGCTRLKAASFYATTSESGEEIYKTQELVNDVLTSLCNRIDTIMADPVYEILNMIPELIYFINANGLGASVNNLLAGVLALISSPEVEEAVGMKLNINDLVTDILRDQLNKPDFTFDINNVNIDYILYIAELFTGLDIRGAIGSQLQYFYMGDLVSYVSASGKLAYRAQFSEEEYKTVNKDGKGNGQLSDFITILLSMVVDVVEYKQNAATIVSLVPGINISVEMIEGIIDFLHDGYIVDTLPFDWFYFDEHFAKYEKDADGKLVLKDPKPEELTPETKPIAPTHTLNYLTYASDWTEETAAYIYKHRNEIITEVLKLAKQDSTDLGEIIKKSVDLEKTLYTADNLNKILNLVQPTLGDIDDALLQILNIVIDIDLSSLKTMKPFTSDEIKDRTTFVNGLCEIIRPLYPILDWLLFGKNIEYFDKMDYETGHIEKLISLPGSNGYYNGLVPLLEALGVILPDEGNTTGDIFYALINNILARAEGILSNPVDEVLALIPELLYFINANGLATCVNNLLSGVVSLLDKINPALGDNAIDLETLINKVFEDANVNIDLSKLDLYAILGVVEDATGIKLIDIFSEKKIEDFYFGKLVYNENSASPDVSFKMVYSETEGPEDMLTFIVNLAIEVLLYKNADTGADNAKAIDILINGKDEITGEPKKNTVQAIVNMLQGIKSAEPIDLNWNYFDEDETLGAGITVPANAFVYLNYSNDWTYDKAAYLDKNLDNLIVEILKLTGSDVGSVSELLNLDLMSFMNAKTLNDLLGTLRNLLYGENAVIGTSLLELAGLVLGADLSQWNAEKDGAYAFEDYNEGTAYEGTENGLSYRTVDGIKTYAIGTPDNFADGLAIILKPAERLLGWLLNGETYGFFVPNSNGNTDSDGNRLDDELIRLTGADGYDSALVILLEALGCKNLKRASEYKNCSEMVSTVIKSLVARVGEILSDPVNEALALIPEIIYFINAGGLNAVVNNLAGPVLALLEEAEPLTNKAIDIDTLLTGVIKDALGDKAPADFTFTLKGVNLQWVIDLAEMFTGLEISDAIGYGLEKFALGVVEKYDSASTRFTETYKMHFSTDDDGTDNARDRADLITILFSVILDVLEYDPENNESYPNADALAALINSKDVNAEMIKGIIKVIKGYVIDGVKPVDWFYFDDEKSVYDKTTGEVKNPLPEYTEDSVKGIPENTINYLTYASDWSRETAKYLNDNLDAVIAEVLSMSGKENTTVAEILAESFKLSDLYTADNLNAIVSAVKGLTDQIGETLTNLVGMILGADLSAYNTMSFTDADITDRDSFVNGLVTVLTPLTPILDWLLFGNSLQFFSAKDTPVSTDVKDLINITGYAGYETGLVPLLEALGIVLPDCTTISSATELLKPVVTAALTRVENILANPVDEVLGLLPNILYFINANGISASVQNLLGAVFGLLDTVNPILKENAIDVNALINDLLAKNNITATVDINNLDLLAIVRVLEAVTGLKIADVVTAEKLDNFRIGNIEYFKSSNGKAAFRMVYSDTQGKIDMITVLVNFLIEVAMTDGNAEALESLLKLNAGTVSNVVTLLKGQDSGLIKKTFKWNYFDETVDLNEKVTTVPAYSFVYLNYANDWTYDKAAYLDSGLTALVNGVLKLTGSDVTVEELIAQNVDLNKLVFNADVLNKLLTTVSSLFYGENAVIGQHLGEVAGLVLGGELSQWNGNYSFTAFDSAVTYFTDGETGLRYTVDSGKAIFAIENSDDFIAGLCKILKPLDKVLGWLLLGDSYGFFVDSATGNVDVDGKRLNGELIKITGKEGYKYGLGYLLEALGVKNLKSDYADADALLKDVLTQLVARVNEILANPIDEVLALIPELIYFINANGLSVVVNNLLASVMNIYNTVKATGLLDSIEEIKNYATGEELVNGLVDGIIKDKVSADITFTLDGINLEWILNVVEVLTGLDLRSHINSLEKFAIGEVYKYESVSGLNAYKMRYGKTGNGSDALRDRADMITIVLSYVIDLLTIEQNQTKIEELAKLNAGTVASVLALLNNYKIEIGVDVNWFYFDKNVDLDTITPETNLKEFTPTINYLTYYSDWTESLADYLDDNLEDVIAQIFEMTGNGDQTVAQIVKGAFDPERDLYNAETLNKLVKSISDLTSKVDETLLNTLGLILDVDLGAYAKMDFGTGRIGRDDFIDGICEIVTPLAGVLDWLLFGDSYNFFSNNKTGVQSLITLNGYSGYAYGLVPLLEALGVVLPDVTAEANTSNTVRPLVTALLDRIDAILVDPVNEALALIPNLLYFINANGLASAVNNLLGAALGLVNKFNEEKLIEKLGLELDLDGDGVNDTKIDLNGLVNKLLKDNGINVTLDIKKLGLIEIVKVLEAFTGMDLTTFVRENGIENFFLGQITYFKSANGSAAFRMEYSSDKNKDRSDLITVVFNYLIEAVLYGDNAKALDILISGANDDGTPKKNTVGAIVSMLGKLGTKALPGDFHWNYMNEDSDDVTPEPEYTEIVLPATPFNNYLTYCTDWTQNTADYLYDNLGTLVDSILKMSGNQTVSELIGGSFNLYQAEYLNKILDATKKLYELADTKVIKLLGLVLGLDLSKWDGMEFIADDITDASTFAAGLTEIVEPIYRLLDWLLFGENYGFFVDDKTGNTGTEGKTLINIAGADGYINGLAPLFIALGVELPEYKDGYTCKTVVNVDGVEMTFFNAVIKAVLARVDTVLANPVDEALDLLPGLLYFINANGVSTAAYNLLGGVLNAVNVLVSEGVIDLGGTSIEEYVETKLGLNVKNLDLEGIVKFLEAQNITKGIKIYDVFKGIYTVDGGKVTFTRDLSADGNLLEKFYTGEVKPYTYSGINGWKMVTKAGTGRGDMITTLLSIVLEVLFYEGNEQPITDIIAGMVDGFTVDNFRNLKALLSTGVDLEAAMKNIDWVYFKSYATDAEREEAIKKVLLDPASNVLPATQPVRTVNYLKYSNNWNEATAKYIDDNITEIVDLVIAKFVDGSDSLTDLINSNLNIYTDDIANKLLAKIGDMLKKLDDSLIETIGVVLDVDLKALTAPVSGITDKTTFVAALANRLSNIGNVLDWILFNQQMTFFTDLETGAQAKIVLNGGEGYKYGLAPILEAIGVDTHITVPAAIEGTSITARVLVELLTNVCDRIDEVLADPINEVLALLPELIYFVNANGVSVSATNLVAPIDALLKEVGKNIGQNDLDFASLIKFDLSNLDFEGIFALVLDKTGIDAQSPIGDYLAKFYFGQLEPYQSYDGVQGFRMVYSETEKRYEFVTVLLALVLDVATYSGNKDAIIKLLGDDEKAESIYNTVMAFLTGNGYTQVPMLYFDWDGGDFKFTDRVGEVFSPMITGSIFEYVYGPLYTREMGEYITKWLPHFIDTMITLLGVEVKGISIKSLDDLIKSLIGESIYTTELLNKLLDLIKGLIPQLKEALGDELFNHLANIVNNSIGVDLNYWNDYTVNEITTGDQTAFVNEVVRMLRPAYPILEWLLCDKDLAFFNTQDGEDYIVIESAEGYAYGIIPILEALHCEGILSIDAYKAAAAENKDNILTNILTPLLTKVDSILKDPVNQVLDILPSVIYFLNIGGLDTVVRNTLNAVVKVLETVEPVAGKDLDLATLLGFDFKVDIEGLLDQALKSVEEKYGFKLATVATEAIKELTVGKLVTFDSLSGQWVYDGKQAYTMIYAGESADKIDMVTIVLRLILRFISDPNNVQAIEAMLKPNLSESGYKFLTSLLDNFSQMCGTTDGMDKIMYTVYYIFYSANVAASETENWLADFNGNYSFLNQLFATSDLAFMRQLGKTLGDLLNKYTPDIADDDEIVPNGFIKFFKSIAAFFQKIIKFFQNMFK